MIHPLALQSLFSRYVELLQRRSRRENDGTCQDIAFPRRDAPLAVLRIDTLQAAHHELGSGGNGLLLGHRTQIVTGDPFGEAGEALDLLDAQKLSADDVTGTDECASPQPPRRPAGGHAGDAAPSYHHVEFFFQAFTPT